MKRFASLVIIVTAVAIIMAGCGKNGKDSVSQSTGTNTLPTIPTGSGTGTGTGTGTNPGNELVFVPDTVDAAILETVNFQLTGGTPPYQIGWRYADDCRSYSSYTLAQGGVDQYSGAGWYAVGPLAPSTDRLCAVDSAGGEAYLTVSVSGGGTGTGTGTGSGTGSGTGTGTGTGTERPATIYCSQGAYASGTEDGSQRTDGELYTYRDRIGWAKFDISMIDPTAKIWSITLHYHVNKFGSGDQFYANGYLSDVDPQNSTESVLTDGMHSSYGGDKVKTTRTGWTSERLSSSHDQWLTAAIAKGQGYVTLALRTC
ncbi:MAG: hypothetical protein ACYS8W_11590 [Planctomycetota bacterium]|jgi:hypothetical protein